jgi:hypothetical protein
MNTKLTALVIFVTVLLVWLLYLAGAGILFPEYRDIVGAAGLVTVIALVGGAWVWASLREGR